MNNLFAWIPILIGAALLLYVFTLGNIASNHSVQQYMLLAAALVCASIGFAALAVIARR